MLEGGREDSNLRRLSRRVYSPFPLAARAHPQGGGIVALSPRRRLRAYADAARTWALATSPAPSDGRRAARGRDGEQDGHSASAGSGPTGCGILTRGIASVVAGEALRRRSRRWRAGGLDR